VREVDDGDPRRQAGQDALADADELVGKPVVREECDRSGRCYPAWV
jgi:hypothetical protein